MQRGEFAKIYWNNDYLGVAELRNLVCKQEEKELWEVLFDGKSIVDCFWVEGKNILKN